MTMHYQPGRYAVRITKQAMGEAKTGNPQLALTFEPYKMENQAVPEGQDGRWVDLTVQAYERTTFWTLTDKTLEWMIRRLEYLGITLASWSDFNADAPGPEPGNQVGERTVLECSKDFYNGEDREKWDTPNTGGDVKPLPPAKILELDAMFGSALKGRGGVVAPIPVPVDPPESKPLGIPTASVHGGSAPPPPVAAPTPTETAVAGGDDLPF